MIAVLDYGIGNLRSAEKALQHLGVDAALTTDPAVAREATLGSAVKALGNTGEEATRTAPTSKPNTVPRRSRRAA